MKQEEHKVPVRFPLEVWEMVKDLAQEDQRSINSEIVWILKNYGEGRKRHAKSVQVSPLSKQDD